MERTQGDGRQTDALVADLLGIDNDATEVQRLVHALPRWSRTGQRTRLLVVVVAVAAVLTGASFVMQRPVLVLTTPPVAGNPLTPAPVVELHSAGGSRLGRDGDTVTVSVAEGPGRIVGNTQAISVAGRAEFGQLDLTTVGVYILRFSSRRYRAVASDTVRLLSGISGPVLRIVGGTINGQVLQGDHPAVRAHPGERMDGTLELEYSSYWAAAAVFLCSGQSWGDPARTWKTVVPLATPIVRSRRTIAVSLTAPDSAGIQLLVLAEYADRECDYIMSATNWTAGSPVWGDGNDLARLPEAELEQSSRTGTVLVRQLRAEPGSPERSYRGSTFGVAVVRVLVE
jgi:hypothetical protein